MKNLKLFVTTMFVMFVAVVGVSAAEVTTGGELRKCLNDKSTETSCVLANDIEVKNAIDVRNENGVVLDLNNHKLTFKNYGYLDISISEVTLTIQNGVIEQLTNGIAAIEMYGGTVTTSNLTVKSSGNVDDSDIPAAFDLSGTGADSIATLILSADTTVEVPNGYGMIISGQSNAKLDGTWNTKKSIVNSASANKNSHITFVGGNYSTQTGAVIKVVKGDWIFNGGTFLSKTDDAINIGAIPKKAENLSIIINDGTFVTENSMHSPVFSSALKGFIYGGTFKAPISGFALNGKEDYIAEGYIYVAEDTDIQKVHVIAKPISIIVENVNDPVEKSDLQKTYSYDANATGTNTKLKQLYSGNTINLDEFLGIRALDNKYYKDYTAIITIKETGEKFYTKLYTNYNAGGMFGSYVIGPDDADNSFVLPKEDVTVTIEFVKTETLKPHKVEVATDITNGSVSVDKTEAKAGETVTVTVKAAEGYKLVKVLVSNGIEVTANEDGTYSFVMPASDVTVSAEFEKVPVNNPTDDGEETDTNEGEENNNNTGNTPADENNSENPSTLDSIVSIVTLAISSLGTAGYSIKKFIRK